MDLLTRIERDAHDFFEKTEKMSPRDRVDALKLLLQQYSHLSSASLVVNSKDFFNIVATSKSNFSTQSMPLRFHNKQMELEDLRSFCVINAFISYLNSNNALPRKIEFEKLKVD